MKTMNAVSVEKDNDGNIIISQPDQCAESWKASVYITKDQLEIFIEWLEEMQE